MPNDAMESFNGRMRACAAFVRRRRPVGPSITSSRETPPPEKASDWTPAELCVSMQADTSIAQTNGECPV